jgi:hypothetical protein
MTFAGFLYRGTGIFYSLKILKKRESDIGGNVYQNRYQKIS